MPPITVEAPFLGHLGVVGRQLPPIALPLGRAKAGRQHALAHSVGQPTGIGLIGLAPRHLLHMGGIDHATATFPSKRFNTGCPYSPVPSMATGVVPASTSQSPDANQSTGIVSHCLRSMTSSGCRPVRIRGDAAGHHALSRHNQPRTMAEDHVHAAPPWEKGLARYPCIASLPGVLNGPWPIGDRAWCRGVSGSTDVTGSRHQA
jgi:hypothetical protein